jgi:hypothetical protein
MSLIVISALSHIPAAIVFAASLWLQARRLKKSALSKESTPESLTKTALVLKERRKTARVIIGSIVGIFLLADAVVLWYVVPAFSTSESLADRILYSQGPRGITNSDDNKFVRAASAELCRRGSKSIPAIAAALRTVPPYEKLYRDGDLEGMDYGPGYSPPFPARLFAILGTIGTEQAMQLLREWAGDRNRDPYHRFTASEQILLKEDPSCFAMLEDLLLSKTNTGRKVRTDLFASMDSHYHPILAAPALPYLRLAVEQDILAVEPPSTHAFTFPGSKEPLLIYPSILRRNPAPEASALLARIPVTTDGLQPSRKNPFTQAQRGFEPPQVNGLNPTQPGRFGAPRPGGIVSRSPNKFRPVQSGPREPESPPIHTVPGIQANGVPGPYDPPKRQPNYLPEK